MSAIPFQSFYLECDHEGCGESFMVTNDVDMSAEGVRREADATDWLNIDDKDYCWQHHPPDGETEERP